MEQQRKKKSNMVSPSSMSGKGKKFLVLEKLSPNNFENQEKKSNNNQDE